MKFTRREHLMLVGGALAGAAAPAALMAQDVGTADDDATPTVHEVLMLNADPDNRRERQVFVPDIVRANPGDTIRFVSADRGHNSAADEDMIPEGAEPWRSDIGDDFEITLDVEGAYGYYCVPHRSAGMVGLILVGEIGENYEALKDRAERHRRSMNSEAIVILERALTNRRPDAEEMIRRAEALNERIGKTFDADLIEEGKREGRA